MTPLPFPKHDDPNDPNAPSTLFLGKKKTILDFNADRSNHGPSNN